jgi:cephalosporin hydroxylase/predicted O-methyltransferase YrrM
VAADARHAAVTDGFATVATPSGPPCNEKGPSVFPFWDVAIAPLIEAAEARRVVEIGALRGETTVQMLGRLGSEVELHVIDPVPLFDPAEHERAFPGRYYFHEDISHNVLPDLPPVDVALIDGDHNWYTVFHELEMLAETARKADRPLPVLVLHDVCWPYGRRDLYYEPSRIPEEFRQPYRQAGMDPNFKRLWDEGGMNAALHNAEMPGGPRNGVMTALDDFVEAHDRPLRRIVLPFYFGLAIVAEEDRIAATPALGEVLDRLSSAEGRQQLLELSERIRIDAAVREQNWTRVFREQIERGAERYLDVVAAALLDEHYIDNELRIEYLGSLPQGTEPDLAALRDPARHLSVRYDRLVQARIAGRSTDVNRNIAYFPYTDMGREALGRLRYALDVVEAGAVPGDLVECGVGRGGGAIFLRAYLEAHEVAERQVWVVDPFVASDPDTADDVDLATKVARFHANLHQVRDGFARFGLLDDRVRFLQGRVPDVLSDDPIGSIALLALGGGLGPSLPDALARLHPRVSPGGLVVVEGVSDPAVDESLRKARDELGITAPIDRIDWNTVIWQVPIEAGAIRAAALAVPGAVEGTTAPARVLLAPRHGDGTIALSVVVVFYDMRRESTRTLHSLSRSYQRDVDGIDYEVIVVDNGSAPDERLTEDEVLSYGPEFHFIDMGADASPSPTAALNRGIAAARGQAIAVMIDGAHVLTPGVISLGLAALDAFEPAVVAVQQWYLGPGQQGDALHAGYDQATEDRLLTRIRWPEDGYRLFEIGHFIGDRDWFDSYVESNFLLAPRSLFEQIGGFDDSFSMPAAGYANLDIYERMVFSPDVRAASLLGEASFHQTHGGTTTNVASADARRQTVHSFTEHFRELRGRDLAGSSKPVHYLGAMGTKAARRTRSRREITLRFDPLRDPVDADSAPVPPSPVSDELRLAAIEAIWNHQAWRDATWLGVPVGRLPSDLYALQELLADVGPDVVLVLGDDEGLGGRALFAASVCDQLGRGRVIAVGRDSAGEVPAHARITRLVGAAETPEVAAQVKDLVAEGENAVVVIGLGAVQRVVGAFEHYAPLVGVGSYVVVENTIVHGRPVASNFGLGPWEAVNGILERHREFVADPTYERYTVTFNKGGFLKRMAPAGYQTSGT